MWPRSCIASGKKAKTFDHFAHKLSPSNCYGRDTKVKGAFKNAPESSLTVPKGNSQKAKLYGAKKFE